MKNLIDANKTYLDLIDAIDWLRAKAQANHMPYCVDYIMGYGYPFVVRQSEQLEQEEKVAKLESEILNLKGWNEVFE